LPIDEQKRVAKRYSELAGHLKACWAFEQFFHRLSRTLPDLESNSSGGHFRDILDELQETGRGFETRDAEETDSRLDDLERQMRRSAVKLSEQDSRVSASDLRRFLGRVRRLDEDLLLALLRFYVFMTGVGRWSADTVDKVDFLLSRLGEEIAGPLLSQDRVRLTSSLASLRAAASGPFPAKEVLAAMRGQIIEVKESLEGIESLEDLEESGIVPAYRKLKHGLGPMLVEPGIARAVLRTNNHLGRLVQRLYDEEEWHLAAGFARMARLQEGAELTEHLSLEMESLRLDMERLEEGRRHDDVRIAAVRRVRQQADSILPLMDSPPEEVRSQEEESPEAPGEPEMQSMEAPDSVFSEPQSREEVAKRFRQRLFGQLEALLVGTDSVDEAEAILQDPGLPFGLERREIEAFMLLRAQAGHSDEDRMLLTAAALRLRLNMLRDHLEAGGEGQAEEEAQSALELSEFLLGEFDRYIEAAERMGAANDAAELQLLKVMLMKNFSILWLEVRGAS
jgi:hypothetical protein